MKSRVTFTVWGGETPLEKKKKYKFTKAKQIDKVTDKNRAPFGFCTNISIFCTDYCKNNHPYDEFYLFSPHQVFHSIVSLCVSLSQTQTHIDTLNGPRNGMWGTVMW